MESYAGTPEDPHIIENVTINGQDIRTCITIEDSGEHFIIQNCTLYNSGPGTGPWDAGIFLTKVENGTVFNNNISYNDRYGILVWDCNNTDISDNILNNNTKDGIYIGFNCNYHNIVNNTIKYNGGDNGININGNFFNISKNVVSHNDEGGIDLGGCYYTNVSDNTVNFNGGDGIKVDGCEQIKIYGNLVYENDYSDLGLVAGIRLRSSNNTHISQNKVNNNHEDGIYMENSNYNNVTKNTINNNNGNGIMFLAATGRNTFNWISRNIINNNTDNGILMGYNNNYNNISGNTINTNGYTGISVAGCNYTNICGNLVYENGWGVGGNDVEGIYVEGSNNIIGGNYLKNNKDIGIEISSEFALVDSEHNIVVGNTLINNNITITEGLFEDVEDTIISCNKFIDDLFVELPSMFFSTEIFNISFRVVDKNRYGINGANIQLWWDGIDVSPNIREVGNGIYNVSMTPITVSPIENPILLNMTVSAQYYYEKYYETYIAVEVEEEVHVLCIDLIKQFYSDEYFNLTFYIYNASNVNQGIASLDSHSIFWNGTDVSANFTSLGTGNYTISLKPITVSPGENLIRLNGDIYATSIGFEIKNFEFFIGIDPEVIDKAPKPSIPAPSDGDGDGAKKEEEPILPLTTLGVIGIGAAIGAGAVAIFLIKKKGLSKRESK